MPRDFSRQVNAKKRIGVEMMKGQGKIRRKVIFECDVPRNGQVRFIEVGVRLEIKLPSSGDRVYVEISSTLLVQGEILKMNMCLDCGLLGSSAGSHRKIGDAIRGESAGLEARQTG